MDIGKRIQDLRKEKGLSRDALARASGMAANSIYLIESGRRPNPSSESLEKLAHGLGASVSELFSEELTLAGKAEAPGPGRPENMNDWLLGLLRDAEAAYRPEGIPILWSEETFERVIRRIGETALRATVMDLGAGNRERAMEILQLWVQVTANLKVRKALLERHSAKASKRHQTRIRRDLAESETLERQLEAQDAAYPWPEQSAR